MPVALVGEVEDLIVEARDFVFAEDDFEAKLAHEHFQQYCAEHLKSPGEANVSGQAKGILTQARAGGGASKIWRALSRV